MSDLIKTESIQHKKKSKAKLIWRIICLLTTPSVGPSQPPCATTVNSDKFALDEKIKDESVNQDCNICRKTESSWEVLSVHQGQTALPVGANLQVSERKFNLFKDQIYKKPSFFLDSVLELKEILLSLQHMAEVCSTQKQEWGFTWNSRYFTCSLRTPKLKINCRNSAK